MSNLPITGWPAEVIGPLAESIYAFIGQNGISQFYIGRTNDLAASKSRHGCDGIYGLYQTDSVENAMEVEDTLIKAFINHQKCCNDADHSGGGASDEYACFVYIAAWY